MNHPSSSLPTLSRLWMEEVLRPATNWAIATDGVEPWPFTGVVASVVACLVRAQPPLPTKDDCRSVAGYLNCIHFAQPDLRLCSWMSLLACGFGDFPVRSDPASFLAHRLFLHLLRPQATTSAARCRQTTPRPPPPGTQTPIAPAACRSRSRSRFARTSGFPAHSSSLA